MCPPLVLSCSSVVLGLLAHGKTFFVDEVVTSVKLMMRIDIKYEHNMLKPTVVLSNIL